MRTRCLKPMPNKEVLRSVATSRKISSNAPTLRQARSWKCELEEVPPRSESTGFTEKLVGAAMSAMGEPLPRSRAG